MPYPGKIILALSLCCFIVLVSCKEQEEFQFNTEDLTGTDWGIPQIMEPGPGDIDLDAPTRFYEDGTVSIGTNKYDFWTIRDSRSIFLEVAGEVWIIIDLSPERLYVEKLSFPQGAFIVKCIYYPMESEE